MNTLNSNLYTRQQNPQHGQASGATGGAVHQTEMESMRDMRLTR